MSFSAGTNDGRLLKVAVDQAGIDPLSECEMAGEYKCNQYNDLGAAGIVYSDIQTVFDEEKCQRASSNDFRHDRGYYFVPREKQNVVLDVKLLGDNVLVVFRNCVVSVPKAQCFHYTCKG